MKPKSKFKVGNRVIVTGKVLEVDEGHSEPYRVKIRYNSIPERGICEWFRESELTKLPRRRAR